MSNIAMHSYYTSGWIIMLGLTNTRLISAVKKKVGIERNINGYASVLGVGQQNLSMSGSKCV